jgi:hypothetical protein
MQTPHSETCHMQRVTIVLHTLGSLNNAAGVASQGVVPGVVFFGGGAKRGGEGASGSVSHCKVAVDVLSHTGIGRPFSGPSVTQ